MILGNYAVDRKLYKNFDDILAKVLLSVGYLLSFRSMRKKLGLLNAQSAVSGSRTYCS